MSTIAYFAPTNINRDKLRTLHLEAVRKRSEGSPQALDWFTNKYLTILYFSPEEHSFAEVLREIPMYTHLTIATTDILDQNDFQAIFEHLNKRLNIEFLAPAILVDLKSNNNIAILKVLNYFQTAKPQRKIQSGQISELISRTEDTLKLRKMVCELRNNGISIRGIMAKTGLSQATVYKYLKAEHPEKSISAPEDFIIQNRIDAKNFRPLISNSGLQEMIEKFLLTRGSFHTRSAYYYRLSGFFKFCKGIGFEISSFEVIDEVILAKYRDHLLQRGFDMSTSANHMLPLKLFLRFLVDKRIIKENPFDYLKFTKKKKVNVETAGMSEEELNLFKSTAKARIQSKQQGVSKYNETRYYLICLILSQVGCRCRSLLRLRKNDIHLTADGPELLLKEKMSSLHRVPLREDLYKFLKGFIETYGDENNPHEFVFARRTSPNRLPSIGALGNYVKRICKKAGISKKITPHSFRVTFATISYNQGMSIHSIKSMLNHANLEQTMHYIRRAENHKILKCAPELKHSEVFAITK